MKKFILIDNSLVGLCGHHFQYAFRILNSAKKLNYTCHLVVNKKCNITDLEIDDINFTIHKCYKYRFWGIEGKHVWAQKFI